MLSTPGAANRWQHHLATIAVTNVTARLARQPLREPLAIEHALPHLLRRVWQCSLEVNRDVASELVDGDSFIAVGWHPAPFPVGRCPTGRRVVVAPMSESLYPKPHVVNGPTVSQIERLLHATPFDFHFGGRPSGRVPPAPVKPGAVVDRNANQPSGFRRRGPASRQKYRSTYSQA